MKTSKEPTKKNSTIQIDSSLEQYRGKILFPEKLAKANALLKNVNLPRKNAPKKNLKANIAKNKKIKIA
jgi:hypothetical protein